jgi:hypothetical protein
MRQLNHRSHYRMHHHTTTNPMPKPRNKLNKARAASGNNSRRPTATGNTTEPKNAGHNNR